MNAPTNSQLRALRTTARHPVRRGIGALFILAAIFVCKSAAAQLSAAPLPTVGTIPNTLADGGALTAEVSRARAAEQVLATNAAQAVGAAIPRATLGQPAGPAKLDAQGTLGANTATAAGGSTARTLAARAADATNVADYGAKCDGSTDDAASVNAAVSVIRARAAIPGTLAWPIGKTGHLTAPGVAAPCVIRSSLNWTGLYGSGFAAELRGATIECKTNGTPCVDATGMGQAEIDGLSIHGSCTTGEVPSFGLVLGRVTNNNVGADHNIIWRPTITGCFTKAPYFNNQSETTLVEHATFIQNQPGTSSAPAYGAIWDGSNHFNVQSAFTGQSYPADTFLSFNENTCIQCTIATLGQYGVPVWLGGTARHKFVNGYFAAAYGGAANGDSPEPAVVLYFGNGLGNDLLDLDVHMEDNGGKHNLTSLVQFQGVASPVMHGLTMRDNYPEQTGPVFSRGSGVSAVGLEDVDLHMGVLPNATGWWDSATAYTVAGRIYSQDSSYTAPGSFTGTACVGSACTNSIILPSNLTAGSISNPGGVGSITRNTATIGGGNYPPGSALPTITIAAPPAGGQQATASVSYLTIFGFGTVTGGTGYTMGDILTLGGGTCSVAIQARVTATATGGAVTGYNYYNGGHCTVSPPTSPTITGGTGSGAYQSAPNAYQVEQAAISVTYAGGGYTATPTVTFSGGSSATAATGTATLNSSLTASAGAGQVVMDGTGTKLGVSGSGGAPVIAAGAIEQGATATSTPASGATIAAAANTDSYLVDGLGTLAALTVQLPPLTGRAGQTYELTTIPAVTALTVQTSTASAVGLAAGAAGTAAGQTRRWKVFVIGGPWRPVL